MRSSGSITEEAPSAGAAQGYLGLKGGPRCKPLSRKLQSPPPSFFIWAASALIFFWSAQSSFLNDCVSDSNWALSALTCAHESESPVPSAACQAEVNSGLIEYVRWGPIGRLGLIRNLPGLYDGRHIEHPLAERKAARRIEFDLDAPVDVMVDGEVLTLHCQELDVLPGALNVVA